jgi:hypothetical protein
MKREVQTILDCVEIHTDPLRPKDMKASKPFPLDGLIQSTSGPRADLAGTRRGFITRVSDFSIDEPDAIFVEPGVYDDVPATLGHGCSVA